MGQLAIDFRLYKYELIPEQDHVDCVGEEEIVKRHLTYRRINKK